MPNSKKTIKPNSLFKYCGITKYSLAILLQKQIYLSVPSGWNLTLGTLF